MKSLKSLGEVVLLIAGIAALLLAEPVRTWADQHGVLLYVAALALLTGCVLLGDLWWTALSKLSKVTDRDRALFARFEESFPRHTGDIAVLRDHFNGKRWNWGSLRQVTAFADGWGHTEYFDDPKVEAARKALYRAARDFHGDAAGESHVPDESNDFEDAQVHRPEDNGATYAEFEAVQERLRAKGRTVCDRFEDLYRIGRERGL